jgi:biotin--protein ligase
MTLLIRIPLSGFPVHKLVFVQYLFGLALAEACRDDAIMGKWGRTIRLKWPNDVYAVVGEGENGRVKIGGILINSSFGDGNCSIIIGMVIL